MESPRRALTHQRALAALLLLASLGAALIEHRSPLAARVREGKPWPFWLAVAGEGAPSFHLGVYNPVRRSLALIHLPEQMRLEGKRTLGRAYTDALKAGGSPAAATRAVEDLEVQGGAGRRSGAGHKFLLDRRPQGPLSPSLT